jgi:hypothetical protein
MVGCGLLFACLLPGTASAQPIPVLLAVPRGFPLELQTRLATEHDSLEQERQAFLADARHFNSLSADAQTDSEFAALGERRTQHINRTNAFNLELVDAVAARRVTNADSGIRIITGMIVLARQLAWSPEKQVRLLGALDSLRNTGVRHGDGPEGDAIRGTWRDIGARGQGGDFAREAAQGDGQELYAAGTQTRYGDCAIFALASAAGLPYGVVAARAAELIRQGDWESTADRANPEGLIERPGLNGGEVIMLAEAFGQSEVVHSIDFPIALKGGRPVLVDIVSENGSTPHQAVLTKAFFHNGQYPWYEMVDSHQGTQDRCYLSASELNTMLLQDGVAFRPEPGSTVAPLR